MQVNEAHLNKADGAAVGTAFLAYFKVIPWPELAACAAFIYTILRTVQFVVDWIKRKRK